MRLFLFLAALTLAGCWSDDTRDLGTWHCNNWTIGLAAGKLTVSDGKSEWHGTYDHKPPRVILNVEPNASGLPYIAGTALAVDHIREAYLVDKAVPDDLVRSNFKEVCSR